jgi:hypothetical protein
MKLFKMVVCAVTLFAASQSAFAVGKMERDEVRDGQLLCMEKATKGARTISSNERPAAREDGQEAGAVSAQ